MLLLKNIIFTIFVPGAVTVLIPYRILTRNFVVVSSDWGMRQYPALLPAWLGMSFILNFLR